jgi:hypothetical protein
MRLLRLEPKTYGLKVREAQDANSDTPITSDRSEISVADCVAFLARQSPDLAAVVEAWDRLPEPIRQGIVAMVRAAQ